MDLTELKRTISLCKESISSTTQDLTKLTGRSYDRSLDNARPFSNPSNSVRVNNANISKFATKRRNSYENENSADVKKSRVDKDAPSLNSVVQMTKGRTRIDALQDLKTKENPKEKERCKRLFGHLMGTLNSIKKEAEKSCNDPQQITRMKIEKKVEEDHKMINETIQREQNELIRAKRDMQNDLKNLNQRYRAAEAFERWRVEKEKMKGYIRTSKMPFIFYKPKLLNEEIQLRIDQTTREINQLIDTRKKKLESEIERVVKRHLDASGNKHFDGLDFDNIKLEERGHDSLASIVINNFTGKERNRSPANSFASEDYDDMVEEIEITMHDEPVVIHEEEEHNNVMEASDIIKKECEVVMEQSGRRNGYEDEILATTDNRIVDDVEEILKKNDDSTSVEGCVVKDIVSENDGNVICKEEGIDKEEHSPVIVASFISNQQISSVSETKQD